MANPVMREKNFGHNLKMQVCVVEEDPIAIVQSLDVATQEALKEVGIDLIVRAVLLGERWADYEDIQRGELPRGGWRTSEAEALSYIGDAVKEGGPSHKQIVALATLCDAAAKWTWDLRRRAVRNRGW